MPTLVLGGAPLRRGKQRLVSAVLTPVPGPVPGIWHQGRPSLRGRLAHCAVLADDEAGTAGS